jgi:DNA-binding HxlR family transcriptional regulator
MASYGQFCSIARAADLLGQRWTLLVVREALCGTTRFAEFQRGLPKISPTILAARLRELVDANILAHTGDSYRLTASGKELAPIVMGLGGWGQRWLSRALPEDELAIDPVIWDVHRRVAMDALPDLPVVVCFQLRDLPKLRARRYLLLRKSEVSLCTTDPGIKREVTIETDRRTLIAWWRGDISLATARRDGMSIRGPRELVQAFPTWFQRYVLADVAPAVA